MKVLTFLATALATAGHLSSTELDLSNKEDIESYIKDVRRSHEAVKDFTKRIRTCDNRLEAADILIKYGFIPLERKPDAAKALICDAFSACGPDAVENALRLFEINNWTSFNLPDLP